MFLRRILQNPIKKSYRIAIIALISIMSVLSSGCGGGGGDGGSSVQPLVYVGNTGPAIITTDNATTLLANVLFGGSVGEVIPAALTTSADVQLSESTMMPDQFRPLFAEVIDSISVQSGNTQTLVGFSINETLACVDGGSVTIKGSLDDQTLIGTLTFTYNYCDLGGIIYHGPSIVRYDAVDLATLLPTDFTMSFSPLMTIISANPAFNMSVTGAIRMQINFSLNQEVLTANYVSKDNISGKLYQFDGFVVTNTYDNVVSPSSGAQAFVGRVYDSVHGYVDVTTPGPLMYSSTTLSFPDSGGPMLLDGAVGALGGPMRIQFNVLNATQVLIELDLDGDGVYEPPSYTLLWTDLLNPQPLP